MIYSILRKLVGTPAYFVKVKRPATGSVQAVFFDKPHDNYLYCITVHDEEDQMISKSQVSMINDQERTW